jgi:signal transduction histidine kinase
MEERIFEELKTYVGFEPPDEARLRTLHPLAKPHFEALADDFYQRILEHPGARRVLEDGEQRVGALKTTLIGWMDTLLSGPWGRVYFERRCRIGRAHVRIGLPQHYMPVALNVVRQELDRVIDEEMLARERAPTRTSADKILDIELAIMLETYREDLLAQQARKERLATYGQLVGSIGHELRNPLGVIESSAFILNRHLGEEDQRAHKHLMRIAEHVEIANRLIGDLLDLIHDRPLTREALRLQEVIEAAASDVPHSDGVRLDTVGLAGLPPMEGNRNQLRQAFLNLIKNAVEAVGEIGNVWLQGQPDEVGRSFEVSIEDSGPGVDPAIQSRLFEPLVTTKEQGIGLGLPLVKRIVERHGGSIRYERGSGGGARFVMTLPRSGGSEGEALPPRR